MLLFLFLSLLLLSFAHLCPLLLIITRPRRRCYFVRSHLVRVAATTAAPSRPSRARFHHLWNNNRKLTYSPFYDKFIMTTKSVPPGSITSGVHKRRRRTANDNGAHAQIPQSAVDDPPPTIIPQKVSPLVTSGAGGGSSSFRNVSACNRCRLRKNRCDQRLPACLSCEKASVKCVGYDPITKREIPRRWEPLLYSS